MQCTNPAQKGKRKELKNDVRESYSWQSFSDEQGNNEKRNGGRRKKEPHLVLTY